MHSKEGCCWPGSLCPSCCSLLLGQAWDCAGPRCASPAWRCCQKMRSSACSGTGLLVGWGGHCFPVSDRGKVLLGIACCAVLLCLFSSTRWGCVPVASNPRFPPALCKVHGHCKAWLPTGPMGCAVPGCRHRPDCTGSGCNS